MRSISPLRRIDVDLEQPPLVVDDAKLVDPAAPLALDLDAGDLTGQLATKRVEDVGERT